MIRFFVLLCVVLLGCLSFVHFYNKVILVNVIDIDCCSNSGEKRKITFSDLSG